MKKLILTTCLAGLAVCFSACEKNAEVDKIPQLVTAQNAKQASQLAGKINIRSVVSLDSQSESFQNLLKSQPYQNFLASFPQGLDALSLRMATFDMLAGESAIVGKVANSNVEFVAYLVEVNGVVEHRIMLKDQHTTVDKKGQYSGEFSLLNELGQVVKTIIIHKNRVIQVVVPPQNALSRTTCFGQCVEAANNEIESSWLTYIACELNPCWIAIAASCAYDCS